MLSFLTPAKYRIHAPPFLTRTTPSRYLPHTAYGLTVGLTSLGKKSEERRLFTLISYSARRKKERKRYIKQNDEAITGTGRKKNRSLAGVFCVHCISITMLVEKGPGVTQGGTTICQGCLNSRLHYQAIFIPGHNNGLPEHNSHL